MTPARIVLGSLVVAVALGCGVWLHSGDTKLGTEHYPAYTIRVRDNPQDPLAIFVAVAGLGLGAAIIVSRPRRAYA